MILCTTMKRLLPLFLILAIPAMGQYVSAGYNKGAGGGGVTWSIAHSALVSNNQTSGVARNLGYTTTASATTIEVACIVSGPTSNSVSSITDNATGGSSTWQTAGAGAKGSSTTGNVISEIWYSYIKSGATTVTVNMSSTVSVFVYVYEVNGIATSSPVDVVGNKSNATGSGTSQVGASLTTTVSGDFIVGCDAPNAGTISGASAAYTADSTSSGVGFVHFTSTAASAGAHQVTYTDTASNDAYETSDVAFKHN